VIGPRLARDPLECVNPAEPDVDGVGVAELVDRLRKALGDLSLYAVSVAW
jgi:hypothetical protein